MELSSSLVEQIIKDYQTRTKNMEEDIKQHISDKKNLKELLSTKNQ